MKLDPIKEYYELLNNFQLKSKQMHYKGLYQNLFELNSIDFDIISNIYHLSKSKFILHSK